MGFSPQNETLAVWEMSLTCSADCGEQIVVYINDDNMVTQLETPLFIFSGGD